MRASTDSAFRKTTNCWFLGDWTFPCAARNLTSFLELWWPCAGRDWDRWCSWGFAHGWEVICTEMIWCTVVMTWDSKVCQFSVWVQYSGLSRCRSIELMEGVTRGMANHFGKDITKGRWSGAVRPIVRSNRISTWARRLFHWIWWRLMNMKSIRLEWSPCRKVGVQLFLQWIATRSRSRIIDWNSYLSFWIAWLNLGSGEFTCGASAVKDKLQSPAMRSIWFLGTWRSQCMIASNILALSWSRVCSLSILQSTPRVLIYTQHIMNTDQVKTNIMSRPGHNLAYANWSGRRRLRRTMQRTVALWPWECSIYHSPDSHWLEKRHPISWSIAIS